jgi:transcriptional activator protein Pur-alpha
VSLLSILAENSDEKELASQQLQIQSKRFYIDVKENQRGRFIKLAEVGVGGRKSRILMTMSVAAEFKSRLGEFAELHSSMG